MNKTDEQHRRRVAGYMAAVARLLSGGPGRRQEFMDRVQLLVGGSAPNFPTLMHWGDWVERHGRPILHFSPTDDPAVPNITLVAHVGGQTHTIENCMLWMGQSDDRARLVPDSFNYGSFVLGDDLRLRRTARVPARDFKHALPGMKRAYERLIDLEIEQRGCGEELPLPERLREAA